MVLGGEHAFLLECWRQSGYQGSEKHSIESHPHSQTHILRGKNIHSHRNQTTKRYENGERNRWYFSERKREREASRTYVNIMKLNFLSPPILHLWHVPRIPWCFNRITSDFSAFRTYSTRQQEWKERKMLKEEKWRGGQKGEKNSAPKYHWESSKFEK